MEKQIIYQVQFLVMMNTSDFLKAFKLLLALQN